MSGGKRSIATIDEPGCAPRGAFRGNCTGLLVVRQFGEQFFHLVFQ